MYAIVNIAGQQFRVAKDSIISTQKIAGNEGDKIELDNVLLLSTGDEVKIGNPSVEGAKIKATVVEQYKGSKVIVFKKKRRKGYRVKNGHRQQLTKLKIEDIVA